MHNKLECYIQAIEMCAPDTADLQQLPPLADILPPREKRRASPTVNLSLYIADKLQQQAKIDADKLRAVFASSDGDMDIFDYLSDELSQPEPAVSPMMFHQSLHNSPSGNWNIAAKSNQSTISISAGEDTFAGGLLTSIIDVCESNTPVLFVAYNVALPSSMDKLHPKQSWFGVGFVFTHEKTENSIAKIVCSLAPRQERAPHFGNPIARALPLLKHIENKCSQPFHMNYLDMHSLRIDVEEYY